MYSTECKRPERSGGSVTPCQYIVLAKLFGTIFSGIGLSGITSCFWNYFIWDCFVCSPRCSVFTVPDRGGDDKWILVLWVTCGNRAWAEKISRITSKHRSLLLTILNCFKAFWFSGERRLGWLSTVSTKMVITCSFILTSFPWNFISQNLPSW